MNRLAITKSKAFPAANANNNTDSIDILGAADGTPVCELEIVMPATTALAATKDVDFTVQESDDDSSFATAEWAPIKQVTGITGNGNAASTLRIGIPSNAKRYVNLKCAVEGSGGDITGSSYSLKAYV